eukprot:TRINITY_DN6313_c0_g1_i1.p1 TRINITY_DN6313_c0_g1~~TRINITY_DN6313_c0_g1_i1.p1  ORF type:complete len:165 (+),score=16.79 TRINITY_DN6313_c0_g1_i1:906-1400(+)
MKLQCMIFFPSIFFVLEANLFPQKKTIWQSTYLDKETQVSGKADDCSLPDITPKPSPKSKRGSENQLRSTPPRDKESQSELQLFRQTSLHGFQARQDMLHKPEAQICNENHGPKYEDRSFFSLEKFTFNLGAWITNLLFSCTFPQFSFTFVNRTVSHYRYLVHK